MKRTILLALIGFTLFSCQSNKAILSSEYVAGTSYSGTVASGGSNGIKQVVVLDSNNRFRMSETYVGQAGECTEKCGTWSVQNGKLMLFSDTATIAQYAVSGPNLVYLAENNVSKSKSGQGMLSRKKLVRSKKINKEFLEGLDVVAFSADASWSLDIHHNKGIQFSVAGLDAPIAFSPVTPKLSGDSLVYNIITAEEKMNIVFAPGSCGDGESVYDYKVTIRYKGKTYYGCGAIMNADGGLDGTWMLQSFQDHKNNWSERPYLVVDVINKKFFGFTGCNDFAGTTRLRETSVCFSDIHVSTSKECAGYDEDALIQTLVKCNGYTIRGTSLELTHDGNVIMVFQRKYKEEDQQ